MSWDWEKLRGQQQKRGEVPPQIDEFFKKIGEMKVPNGLPFILLIAVLLIALSTFYTIDVDEVGIVQRFGKYMRTDDPGLNFKMPIGIERVTKVKIRRVYKEEFGFRTPQSDTPRTVSELESNNVSLMLTGDLNVALVPWIVQYRINDPYKYLFKVQNINRLLRDMAEAAMRLVVGDRSINEVINKREEFAEEAKVVLQEELNRAETGITVITIEMKETNVPERVQPSFNEVNQAVQEKEKTIYEAKEEYNKAIPTAKGEAERTIRAAEGYAADRINRAKGDIARFNSLFGEYNKAKDITKRRLYLEMLGDLFPRLGHKYIIDADQKNVLPLLNLDKMRGGEK